MDGDTRSVLGGRDGLGQSSILADPRHRRVLSILQARPGPTPIEELCRRLAAAEDDGSAASDRRSIRIDLQHRCLPSLEAVGWIDRRSDGIHLHERRIVEAIDVSPPALSAPDDPAWAVVSAILARPYRRELLAIVADADGAVTVDTLAAELRKRTKEGLAARSGEDGTLPLALHHVDVPKLAATGVIEYDRAARTVDATRRLRPCLDRLTIETE